MVYVVKLLVQYKVVVVWQLDSHTPVYILWLITMNFLIVIFRIWFMVVCSCFGRLGQIIHFVLTINN